MSPSSGGRIPALEVRGDQRQRAYVLNILLPVNTVGKGKKGALLLRGGTFSEDKVEEVILESPWTFILFNCEGKGKMGEKTLYWEGKGGVLLKTLSRQEK